MARALRQCSRFPFPALGVLIGADLKESITMCSILNILCFRVFLIARGEAFAFVDVRRAVA